MELSGKTVLIVGFGRIGTRTAKRCLGFDMQVLIYDPYVEAGDDRRRRLRAKVTDLDAALPRGRFRLASIARRTRRRWACSTRRGSRG